MHRCVRAVAWAPSPSSSSAPKYHYAAAATTTLLLAARLAQPAAAAFAILPLTANASSVRKSSAGIATLIASDSAAAAAKSRESMMMDENVAGDDHGRETTPPMVTLQTFLERSTKAVKSAANGGSTEAVFHAFSGNEACDADSICSSICLAFLESRTGDGADGAAVVAAAPAPAAAEGAAGVDLRRGEAAVVHVPVMPIPRKDLALRREVLVLFELCRVDPSRVTFMDDVELSTLQAEGKLRLTLVDHNAVSGSLAGLGDSVVEIVDHHMDLGEHAHVRGGLRDIAFERQDGNGKPLVGSCCTLVAERMLEQAPDSLSSDVARLLLGVILLDTVNLDVDAKRATQRDIAAAEQLTRRVAWLPPASAKKSVDPATVTAADKDPRCSPGAFFDALRNAKFDPVFWRGLSARDCLRYDYKQFVPDGAGGSGSTGDKPDAPLEFGMSSVLCRVDTLSEKPEAAEAVRAFALERGIDALIVMTTTLDADDRMKKELLVFADSERRCEQMEAFLEGPPGEFLELQRQQQEQQKEPRPGGGGFFGGSASSSGRFLRWELGNVAPSRKQVAPSIFSFYESVV